MLGAAATVGAIPQKQSNPRRQQRSNLRHCQYASSEVTPVLGLAQLFTAADDGSCSQQVNEQVVDDSSLQQLLAATQPPPRGTASGGWVLRLT